MNGESGLTISVLGAGVLGEAIVRRSAFLPQVGKLRWVNRKLKTEMEGVAKDVRNALVAYAPQCSSLELYRLEDLPRALAQSDLLIVTIGARVPKGKPRSVVFQENQALFLEHLIPVLRSYQGIVLNVTNPLDAVTRLIHMETGLPSHRVIGLGTMVDTARLCEVIDLQAPSYKDLGIIAVGTHDEHVVVDWKGCDVPRTVREQIRQRVISAAEEVKRCNRSTQTPVVESVKRIIEAIAPCVTSDIGQARRRGRLLLSVLDETDLDHLLYYSAPTTVGPSGVVCRHMTELSAQAIDDLGVCKTSMRRFLVSVGVIPSAAA